MKSVFQLEELKALLEDVNRITGIRITVFDSERNELVSHPQERSAFCRLIRTVPEGREACAACDAQACAIASQHKHTHIYQCHAGLTEAITPLHVGSVLVGYLFFGHILCADSLDAAWQDIERACCALPIPAADLRAALAQHPLMSREYIKSAARVLHATASYLVLERMAILREDSPAARLDAYLSAHFTEPLTAQHLCRCLGVSRSRLYELSHQLYSCGITQQLRRLRMDKARRLLRDRPDLALSDIAAACGYPDYNYFIALFTKTHSLSPTAFRQGRG